MTEREFNENALHGGMDAPDGTLHRAPKCELSVAGEVAREGRGPLLKPATEEQLHRGRWMDAWFESMFATPKRAVVMLRNKPVVPADAR